ncbi:MAG: hypothetical protein WAV07_12015, partial [Candidatus Contendobacter sp.]
TTQDQTDAGPARRGVGGARGHRADKNKQEQSEEQTGQRAIYSAIAHDEVDREWLSVGVLSIQRKFRKSMRRWLQKYDEEIPERPIQWGGYERQAIRILARRLGVRGS